MAVLAPTAERLPLAAAAQAAPAIAQVAAQVAAQAAAQAAVAIVAAAAAAAPVAGTAHRWLPLAVVALINQIDVLALTHTLYYQLASG
jgi:hypothetical protein